MNASMPHGSIPSMLARQHKAAHTLRALSWLFSRLLARWTSGGFKGLHVNWQM